MASPSTAMQQAPAHLFSCGSVRQKPISILEGGKRGVSFWRFGQRQRPSSVPEMQRTCCCCCSRGLCAGPKVGTLPRLLRVLRKCFSAHLAGVCAHQVDQGLRLSLELLDRLERDAAMFAQLRPQRPKVHMLYLHALAKVTKHQCQELRHELRSGATD